MLPTRVCGPGYLPFFLAAFFFATMLAPSPVSTSRDAARPGLSVAGIREIAAFSCCDTRLLERGAECLDHHGHIGDGDMPVRYDAHRMYARVQHPDAPLRQPHRNRGRVVMG